MLSLGCDFLSVLPHFLLPSSSSSVIRSAKFHLFFNNTYFSDQWQFFSIFARKFLTTPLPTLRHYGIVYY